jgi:protein tyrosine phosphatase (PTP) superfamily phosphohydrolase (DUF442 family)
MHDTPREPGPGRRLRRFQSAINAALAVFLGAVVAFIIWRIATHNVGTVDPGRLYRSAQLDESSLRRLVTADGIKSVINLRGENPGLPWYQGELALCRELQVRHADVRWSAEQLPSPAEAEKLLQDFHEMPTPILVHCRSGADRTGLATTLFLIDQDHLPWKKAAARGLSLSHGHFPIYPYFPMDEFVRLYGENPGVPLDQWVAQEYPALYAREAKEPKWQRMIEPFRAAFTGSL